MENNKDLIKTNEIELTGNILDELLSYNIAEQTHEFTIRRKFKKADSTINIIDIPIKVKAIDYGTMTDIRNRCITYNTKGQMKMNPFKMQELICIEGCISPDFKDANILLKNNLTSEKLLRKTFLTAEIEKIVTEIQTLCGYTTEEINEDFKIKEE